MRNREHVRSLKMLYAYNQVKLTMQWCLELIGHSTRVESCTTSTRFPNRFIILPLGSDYHSSMIRSYDLRLRHQCNKDISVLLFAAFLNDVVAFRWSFVSAGLTIVCQSCPKGSLDNTKHVPYICHASGETIIKDSEQTSASGLLLFSGKVD
jgi:hypothetical protein